MALGKYSRVDGKKSSSGFCSSVAIVGFVALCLVGIWMMTSSSVVPVQNSDVSSDENQNQVTSRAQIVDDKGDSSDDTQQEQDPSSVKNENPQVEGPEKKEVGDKTEDGESGAGLKGKGEGPEKEGGDKTEDGESGAGLKGKGEGPEKEGGDKTEDGESGAGLKGKGEKGNVESKSDSGGGDTIEGEFGKDSKENKTFSDSTDTAEEKTQKKDKGGDQTEEKVDTSVETKDDGQAGNQTSKGESPSVAGNQTSKEESTSAAGNQTSKEEFPSVSSSELMNETTTQSGSFPTQATESSNEKAAQKFSGNETQTVSEWKLCNTTAGTDYIPCLDNVAAIKKLRTTKHYEHRERHCPDSPPNCLVPLPEGYQRSIGWSASREKIWYNNVPHTKLAVVKGHQNWVKVTGEFLTFPGGGTQFQHGALHYIDFIQESVPDIKWGNHSRVVLDVGCGVASFGGFQFDRDVLTMSLAPKDEHEAQVQFALERGIPAISAVMGTKRLPYPGRVFDVVHCARCRVPWHIEGGKLLLELNRLLRPGGFFIWSATPVYSKDDKEDVEIWEVMKTLTKSMCWESVKIVKDRVNKVGIAIYRKPSSNECYNKRTEKAPPLCENSDDPDAAWNVPLKVCMHKIPEGSSERGSKWPETWPARLEQTPYWLLKSKTGIYGKPAPEDFTTDYTYWKRVFETSYLKGMGIEWSIVRNVMDMRAIYGGFAAALREINVWVMNIVTVDAPDTLPIIYERGLFGIYHDWCESFSTYPRSYDLLHADHLFSKIKKKCNLKGLVTEVDRILRPQGKIIIRDDTAIVTELESMFKSMHWEIRMSFAKKDVAILCAEKTTWRPKDTETLPYAIGEIS